MIEKRNEIYADPAGGRPTRLVASAVLQDGRIWVGKRHFELIRQIKEDGGKPVRQDQQGFWTDDCRFVMRKAALSFAIGCGQIKEDDLVNKCILTSEDLW